MATAEKKTEPVPAVAPQKGDDNTAPLIPETVLDSASQRIFMVSLFVLVQAWKIYDLYVLRHDDIRQQLYKGQTFSFLSPRWSFLFKYFFLDGLAVWLTSILRIPKLNFRPAASVLCLTIMYLLDVLMTLDIQTPTLAAAVPSLWRQLFRSKDLAIEENYVDSDLLADQSNHFKGKMTIRFAPDSSIRLNPFDQTYCLSGISGKGVVVPVAYESANGIDLLQVQYQDLNNVVSTLNYTKRELRSMAVKNGHTIEGYDPHVDDYSMLKMPVTKPGSYVIKYAADTKNKAIRSQKATVIVPMCPETSFAPADTSDKCVEEEIGNFTLNVLGVPPFTLYYEEEINGELSHIPKNVVVPEEDDFHSPLLARELYTGNNPQEAQKAARYYPEDLRDLSWARSRSIDVPLGNRRIDKAGKYTYTVNKIIDGFGNVVEFTPTPGDQDTYLSLIAHPMPLVSLSDPTPNKPILVGQEKSLELKLSQVSCVSCEAPYTVVFKYTPENGGEEEIFSRSFDFKHTAKIPAERPGTYSIETASSKYCSCKVGSSSLNVRQAKLPRVNIAMEPVVDDCVGTTGFKFNYEFVGSAPFEVAYTISKLDPKDSGHVLRTEKVSSLRSESTVLEYEFNPPSEGSYAIEFLSLSDRYYKNQIRFNKHEYRYITYFKQRPRAFFDKSSNVRRLDACNGGSATAHLNLEGKAPFTVTYNLISPDYEVKSVTLSDIQESGVDITTPSLVKGGQWVLAIKDVKDSSSCAVDFKGQEVHVSVRNDISHLKFASEQEYTLVQGNQLRLPLKAESSEHVDLTYRYRSFDGKTDEQKTARHFDPTSGLAVSEEGEYSLVSFEQGGCPGEISSDASVSVKYLPKPSLELLAQSKYAKDDAAAFTAHSVCENGSGALNFRATGVAPFVVKYTVKRPDGLVEEKTQQLPNRNFGIQLKTADAGSYVYTIVGIYDSLYPAPVLDKLAKLGKYTFDPIVVKSPVNALPEVHIANKGDSFQTCVSSLNNVDELTPLRLSLKGALPMDITLSITRDQESNSETIELKKLESKEVNLFSIYENMGLGIYHVAVVEATDANGCIEHDLDKETVTVTINDVPKIRHLMEESSVISEHAQQQMENAEGEDFNYYCVGDYITYMLNGVPPFTVLYEFNGKKQVVKVNSNYFKRRAPRPGEMDIISVSDSSSKNCAVKFTKVTRPDLTARIFDLPSVEIEADDISEADIYEGEQTEITFRFTGQAPFKLTYIRTDLEGKIVETEVVDNIKENEYKVTANLEGTYEAIEIQDAYCIAKNHHI